MNAGLEVKVRVSFWWLGYLNLCQFDIDSVHYCCADSNDYASKHRFADSGLQILPEISGYIDANQTS